MTPDEFEFWQKAYLSSLCDSAHYWDGAEIAGRRANDALKFYRAAKATVVQTTYATRD